MDLRMDPNTSTTAVPSDRRHVPMPICQGLPRHACQPIAQLRAAMHDLQGVIGVRV
jgi:hypothetical protein